jgi:hypothetical protein
MAIDGEVPAKQLLAVEYKPLGAGHLQRVINKAHPVQGRYTCEITRPQGPAQVSPTYLPTYL